MYLIPQPKSLKELGGVMPRKTICLTSEAADERIDKAVKKLPLSSDGIPMTIICNNSGGEGYTLQLKSDGILLEGNSPAGVFYGIQTLRQIYTHKDIPCLYIEDTLLVR